MEKRLEVKKTLVAVISLNAIQIAAAAGIVIYASVSGQGTGRMTGFDNGFFLIFIVIATTLLNSFITVRDIYLLTRYDSNLHILEETLGRLEALNKSLRAQRHDFMNHLQVVYSLIEMDEYRDARDYIEKVYSDIQKVSRILKTQNPAVNALLQAKMLDCEKRGIKPELRVTTQLKEPGIPSWELCRVLGNLIDNAMEALEESKSVSLVVIELFEDLKSFGFRIRNNGPMIPEDIREKIFEPGFTTKPGRGEGMGLAISREILASYGGGITVQSGAEETVFEGWLPNGISQAKPTSEKP